MLSFNLKPLVLAAVLLTGGCATALTLDQISPGEEEDRFDYVADVTAAWRDEAGNVTVCVTGRPAGANSWLGGSRNYSIVYPGASSPVLDVSYHQTIPQYKVTAADVRGGCPKTMKGMTPLPVHSVHAEEFAKEPGGKSWSGMSDKALTVFFETRAEAPAIYRFMYNPASDGSGVDLMNVVYVSEEAGQARAVEIATDFRKRKGKPGYVLLLPFAVAFDIVMFPLQVMAALMHAG